MNKITPFSKAHASTYDEQWKQLSPMMEGLHFLTQILLKNLPEEARILCVGAGTGAEIMALAKVFPRWKFTAVEPAAAMLEMCREKVEQAGFSSQCTFHEGYLSSLPDAEKFDAATAILVSQFLTIENQRKEFFKEIYKRLSPGAYLVSADLALPQTDFQNKSLKETWSKALIFAGLNEERAKASTSSWGVDVAVVKPQEIESIIASSGFENPTLFYQSLFIHGWYSIILKEKS